MAIGTKLAMVDTLALGGSGISLVQSVSENKADESPPTNYFTPPLPSPPTSGNVIFICISSRGGSSTVTWNRPLGFVEIAKSEAINNRAGTVAMYKVAGGSEPTGWTVTSSFGSVDGYSVTVFELSGVDISNVIDGTPTTGSSANRSDTHQTDIPVGLAATSWAIWHYGGQAHSNNIDGSDSVDGSWTMMHVATQNIGSTHGGVCYIDTPVKSNGTVDTPDNQSLGLISFGVNAA